tara:strand:+ start:5412 stop:5579 length:168 start_codon:yes stop_codon:yes gene_type:complete
MRDIVRNLLIKNERSPMWLSRKIGVSHSLVYYWIKKERKISKEHFKKVLKVFKLK